MATKKSDTKIIGVPWNMSGIWNQMLDSQPDRPLVARNYIYASELQGAHCDRYLKMNAVPYTNGPNFRSKRKFISGACWEWILGMVFIAAGIYEKRQIKVDTQVKGMLPVHGRLDFVVGGAFDYDSAKRMIDNISDSLKVFDLDLPPFFLSAADKFVDKYKGQFLQKVIYEGKSVSSFMMEKVKKTGPMTHHVLQDYHYFKGNDQGIDQGKIGYICRDDCTMEEFDITESNMIRGMYVADIKTMTDYYNEGFDKKNPKKFMPLIEPLIVFDEGMFKFSKNWKVEYSPYLTALYGYETPKHYSQWDWAPKANAFNNAFKRFVLDGQEIEYISKGEKKIKIMKVTDNNREKRAEAMKIFPQWDKYVAKAKAAGAFDKAEEGGDDE